MTLRGHWSACSVVVRQVFHALAFGARGISYFACWTPVNVELADVQRFSHGLIERGQPTRHYDEAKRLNRAAPMSTAYGDGMTFRSRV